MICCEVIAGEMELSAVLIALTPLMTTLYQRWDTRAEDEGVEVILKV